MNELAVRLAELSESIGSRPAGIGEVTVVEIAVSEDDDDAPGLADLLADFEPAYERLNAAISAIPDIMISFTEPVQQASADLDELNRTSKPYAARIVLFRRLAQELYEPSLAMQDAGATYASELLSADAPTRALIELAKSNLGKESDVDAQSILDQVTHLVETSRTNLESMTTLEKNIRDIVPMSRDLRPALKRIQSGVRSLIDAQSVLEEWAVQAE